MAPRKLDPIERHFILMDGWEQGLRHRTESAKLRTFEADAMYDHSWRPPPVRSALTEWLAEIGLGHKEGMVHERLHLNLWRCGLPPELGGIPLDLEALISDRGLGYVHRRARGLDLDAVDRLVELLDFSREEETTFRAELLRLGEAPEDPAGVSSVFGSPSSPEKTPKKRKKKKKKAKKARGKELLRLGEDPEMRRKVRLAAPPLRFPSACRFKRFRCPGWSVCVS
jgi:hypothetical protein